MACMDSPFDLSGTYADVGQCCGKVAMLVHSSKNSEEFCGILKTKGQGPKTPCTLIKASAVCALMEHNLYVLKIPGYIPGVIK